MTRNGYVATSIPARAEQLRGKVSRGLIERSDSAHVITWIRTGFYTCRESHNLRRRRSAAYQHQELRIIVQHQRIRGCAVASEKLDVGIRVDNPEPSSQGIDRIREITAFQHGQDRDVHRQIVATLANKKIEIHREKPLLGESDVFAASA
jgi:hypothetical protein